jgi:hypothetical protein
MKAIALVVAVLAVAVLAQTPTPCESPKEFECRIVEVDPTKEFEGWLLVCFLFSYLTFFCFFSFLPV